MRPVLWAAPGAFPTRQARTAWAVQAGHSRTPGHDPGTPSLDECGVCKQWEQRPVSALMPVSTQRHRTGSTCPLLLALSATASGSRLWLRAPSSWLVSAPQLLEQLRWGQAPPGWRWLCWSRGELGAVSVGLFPTGGEDTLMRVHREGGAAGLCRWCRTGPEGFQPDPGSRPPF